MLGNLHHPYDPQCALGMVRYCLGTLKLVYSLRTNTPGHKMLEVSINIFDGQRKLLDQILAQLLAMTYRNSLPYYQFVGTRRQTVTRATQRCCCGLSYSLRRAGQQNNK